MTVPVRITDALGTALDRNVETHRAIRSLSVTVEPSPPGAVSSIAVMRSGLTADLAPRFETQVSSGARRSWLVSFDQALPFTGGAQEVAQLRLQLASDVAPGTRIELDLVSPTTALSNGSGTLVETADDGSLSLMAGAVDVAPESCTTATTLCLLDDRFAIQVGWTDFQGKQGVGHAVGLTRDSGYFWFFNERNVELIIKTLDGRATNGNYWVFYGALSNVRYRITVTDRVSGQSKQYVNPLGVFASVGDTGAFPSAAPALRSDHGLGTGVLMLDVARSSVADNRLRLEGPEGATCQPSATALCLLGGRFRLESDWKISGGKTGVGHAVSLTDETGYFWFFGPNNVELVVKVLDGRAINGNYWVFYGSLSNVEFSLTATDTATGASRRYANPSGTFASRGDTGAFDGGSP